MIESIDLGETTLESLRGILLLVGIWSLAFVGVRRLAPRLNSFGDRYLATLKEAGSQALRREDESAFESFLTRLFRSLAYRQIALNFAGVLAIAGALVGLFRGDPSFAIGLAAAVTVFPFALTWILGWLEEKRVESIERVLPDAIELVGGAMSAGLTFQTALASAATNLRGPLAVEFRRTANEISAGAAPAETLQRTAVRSGSPFLGMFAAVMKVHLVAGGDVVVTLRDLSRSLARIVLARDEVRSKTEKTRHEARISTVIPFVVVPLLWLMQPSIYGMLATTIRGRMIVLGAGGIWAYFVRKLYLIAKTPV